MTLVTSIRSNRSNAELPLVLLVEDEAPIVEFFSALLIPLGAEVVSASRGEQALRLLEMLHPSLITLDVVLPDMDGFQLLAHIRGRRDLDDVPVLGISAQEDRKLLRRAYESGMSDFITKPFPIELIDSKLRMWLRLAQRAGEARNLRDLAHEARNPLAAITGAAQLMCRDDVDAAMRARLARAIEDEANRLGRLITGALGGEILSQRGGEAAETLSPYRLLLDLIDVNLPDADARTRIRLRITGPLPPLRVHPDRLRQMLLNLIENAVLATAEGGEISIEAFVDERGVAISVSDSGLGIAEEDLPHIFEDGFTRRGGGARGLGLGITQRLCRASGGRLRVTSRLGQGSCFVLWLPRVLSPHRT